MSQNKEFYSFKSSFMLDGNEVEPDIVVVDLCPCNDLSKEKGGRGQSERTLTCSNIWGTQLTKQKR